MSWVVVRMHVRFLSAYLVNDGFDFSEVERQVAEPFHAVIHLCQRNCHACLVDCAVCVCDWSMSVSRSELVTLTRAYSLSPVASKKWNASVVSSLRWATGLLDVRCITTLTVRKKNGNTFATNPNYLHQPYKPSSHSNLSSISPGVSNATAAMKRYRRAHMC